MKKLLILLAVLIVGAALFAQPHPVYIEVWDCDGVQIPAGDVDYTAVILERPAEVIAIDTNGWEYGGVIPGYLSGNVGNGFSTWAPGETLEITLTHISAGSSVVNSWVLTGAGYEYYPNPGGLVCDTGCDPVDPGDIDWLDGVTGNVQGGTPSAPGSGPGTGLPNEGQLGDQTNAGYYFTITIPDGMATDVTICIDQDALGYTPWNLAYWLNGMWNYEYVATIWENPGTASSCVTINIDATRADVPIVLADGPGHDDALPVELTNFAAAYEQGEFVTVSWTTESESEMSYYNVYREGIVIATESATNETESHDYEITDTPEYEGTYYYTLEAVALDGTNSYWHTSVDFTIPVEEIIEITTLNNNYPNPFNPSTTIELSVKEGETGTLTIFNAKGQIVDAQSYGTGEHTHTWDATNFGSGIYFYKLKTDSFSEVKKMLMLK
jgi:hypothetical protein